MPKATDTAQRIREALADGALSSQEISAKTGINMQAVSASIARMVDRGSVKQVNPGGRPPRWGLSERNDGMELLRHWPDPVLGALIKALAGGVTNNER